MKKFTLTFTQEKDGSYTTTSINDGLTSLEIYMLLELKKQDILSQVQSHTNYERTLIKDGKPYAIRESEDTPNMKLKDILPLIDLYAHIKVLDNVNTVYEGKNCYFYEHCRDTNIHKRKVKKIDSVVNTIWLFLGD